MSIFTVNDNYVNNSWCSDGFFENNSKFDEKLKFAQNFEARISEFGLANQKPHRFYMTKRPCYSVTQQKVSWFTGLFFTEWVVSNFYLFMVGIVKQTRLMLKNELSKLFHHSFMQFLVANKFWNSSVTRQDFVSNDKYYLTILWSVCIYRVFS